MQHLPKILTETVLSEEGVQSLIAENEETFSYLPLGEFSIPIELTFLKKDMSFILSGVKDEGLLFINEILLNKS